MKAVHVSKRTLEMSLQSVEVADPTVDVDDVLIKVRAAGVNFADLMQYYGQYPRVIPTPYTPGYEVAGDVVSVGSHVEGIEIGARVAAMLPSGGGFAEYAVANAQRIVRLPPQLDYADANALLTQGLTASILIEKFVEAGQKVLVTAAAGGVGSLAIQLAKFQGASEVYGAVGNNSKFDLISKLGAIPLNYGESDWASLLAEHDIKVDVVIDATGGNVLTDARSVLSDFGSVVSYGVSSAMDLSLTPEHQGALHFKNQSFHFYGFSRCIEENPRLLQQHMEKLVRLKVSGKLSTPLHLVSGLDKTQQALDDLMERKTQGKVVIVP